MFTRKNRGVKISHLTKIVMISAVLSLFSSSSTELSDEKTRVKFFDWTSGKSSSCMKWSVQVSTENIGLVKSLSIYVCVCALKFMLRKTKDELYVTLSSLWDWSRLLELSFSLTHWKHVLGNFIFSITFFMFYNINEVVLKSSSRQLFPKVIFRIFNF